MGVFIGIAPLMPFKSLLILLITLVAGSSTVAAFLVCTAICNPFTYIPLYYFAWLVGNFLLPGRASWETLKVAIGRMQHVGIVEGMSLAGQMGLDTGMVLLAGGLFLALPLALLSYFPALRLFLKIERKRRATHLLNRPQEDSKP